MVEIKTLLDEVIVREIQNLETLSSDEKSDAIKDLVALHKLRVEEVKLQTEADEKSERRDMDMKKHQAECDLKEKQLQQQTTQQERELNLKTREADGRDIDREHSQANLNRQHRNEVVDRYVRIGIAAAELTLPLVFYGIWMKRGFKFEESGVYSSTTFKNLFNRFKPTK